jgi:hypothetical protein
MILSKARINLLPMLLAFVLGLSCATNQSFASDDKPASQPVAKVDTDTSTPVKVVPKEIVVVKEVPATKEATKDGSKQSWWQGTLVFLIEQLTKIIIPILGVLLMLLVRKWQLKVEQDQVDWIVTKAVGFGEQKAKVALKAGTPLDAPETLKFALEHGSALLNQYKLPAKLGEYLADLIEAKLGEKIVEPVKVPVPKEVKSEDPPKDSSSDESEEENSDEETEE